MWLEKQKVIFAHPECDVWMRAPRRGRHDRVGFRHGARIPTSRTGDRTDGVEFTITGTSAGGAERVIFKRYLDPVNRPPDQGTQKIVLPYQPLPGEILRFSDRPGASAAFDWAYWARIEVR